MVFLKPGFQQPTNLNRKTPRLQLPIHLQSSPWPSPRFWPRDLYSEARACGLNGQNALRQTLVKPAAKWAPE